MLEFEDSELKMEKLAKVFGTNIQTDTASILWFDVGGSNSIFWFASENLISKSVNKSQQVKYTVEELRWKYNQLGIKKSNRSKKYIGSYNLKNKKI